MISTDQRKLYWAELNAVLAARKDLTREEFHRLHQLPVSTKDFTRAHFDTFLGAAKAITQPANLKPQLRALNQPKTRLLHKILVEQAAMLRALDFPDPSATILNICRDKFQGRKPSDLSAPGSVLSSSVPSVSSVVKESDPRPGYSDLEKLLFTIARTISEARQKAGWTQHDLNIAANLHCDCAPCCKARRHMKEIRAQQQRAPRPELSPCHKSDPAYAGVPASAEDELNNPF